MEFRQQTQVAVQALILVTKEKGIVILTLIAKETLDVVLTTV